MAERVGFEPTLEFPPNTLSKRAPSATRPPLREAQSRAGFQYNSAGRLEFLIHVRVYITVDRIGGVRLAPANLRTISADVELTVAAGQRLT